VTYTGAGAAEWRKEQLVPYLRCITSLINGSHEGIKELAASALANIVSSSSCGRELLSKLAAVKALQLMLYSNSLGMQKQASRAMVNAWIDENVRVVAGCDASHLNTPFRHTPNTEPLLEHPDVAACNVEWICVDFSPSGAMNPPYTITMSQIGSPSSTGRLRGHGEDSMGVFRLSEATLNRSLQWMSGTCLDDDFSETPHNTHSHQAAAIRHVSNLTSIVPEDATSPPPTHSLSLSETSSTHPLVATPPSGQKSKGCGGVLSPPKRVISDKQSEMLKAAGRSTPKELPHIMAQYRDSMAQDAMAAQGTATKPQRKIAFGEMVDRVAGFQYRYQSQLTAGKLLDVCAGSEYMELLKTYHNGHGDDHVRLLAFGDERGLWGMWERGRYQYQHKMDSCTRGAFRMWKL